MQSPDVEFRPVTADLRGATEAFASRIQDKDRGFLDPFLLYQVAVASWTQATPARRIAAMDGDDIVGMVTVVRHTGWQSHVGDFRVVVQPSHRGRGVGHELIARGIGLARSLGVSKLSVEIMASNAPGLAMFESHGFRQEAVLTRHVRDGQGNLQDLVVTTLEVSEEDGVPSKDGVDAER